MAQNHQFEYDAEWKTVVLRSVTPDGASELEATVATDSPMLLSLRHRDAELIAHPAILQQFDPSLTLGSELLFPFANRLADRRYRVGDHEIELNLNHPAVRTWNDLPIHGVDMTSTDWLARPYRTDDAAWLTMELELEDHAALAAAFPVPGRLTVTFRVVRNTLRVTTILETAGDERLPVSFGWHPFFQIPDTPRSEWVLDLPVRRRLTLDPQTMLPTGSAERVRYEPAPLGDREFDDLYMARDGYRFTLTGGNVQLGVTLVSGYPYAQVFAPSHGEFVCVEPQTARTNALVERSGLEYVEHRRPYEAIFEVGARRVEPKVPATAATSSNEVGLAIVAGGDSGHGG